MGGQKRNAIIPTDMKSDLDVSGEAEIRYLPCDYLMSLAVVVHTILTDIGGIVVH